MSTNRYALQVDEIPEAHGKINPRHLFVLESTQNLSMLGIPHTTDKPFLWGHPTLRVSTEHREKPDTAEISYLTPHSTAYRRFF